MSDEAKFIPGVGAVRMYEAPPVVKSEPRPVVNEYPSEYVGDQFGTMVRPVDKSGGKVAKDAPFDDGGAPKNLVEAVVGKIKADMTASPVKTTKGYNASPVKESDASDVIEEDDRVDGELSESDAPYATKLEGGKARKTLKNEDADRSDLNNEDDDLMAPMGKEMKSKGEEDKKKASKPFMAGKPEAEEEETEEAAEELPEVAGEPAEKSLGLGDLVYLPEYGHRAAVVAMKTTKSATGSRMLVVKGAGRVFEVAESDTMPA